MKLTGLTLPSIVVQEMVEAGECGELERLQARCRMWDEKHPDAPACFGTDAWVPALWTAASMAAQYGRLGVLRWLVEERGVPVHRATPEEQRQLTRDKLNVYQTPLTMAVYKGREATALYLLRAGLQRGSIDVDYGRTEKGGTFLHAGARKGISADLMAALVEEGGFDPQRSTLDPDYLTPLAIAAEWGHVHLVDYFLNWARRQDLVSEALAYCLDKDKEGDKLTYMAVRFRQLAVLRHVVATVPELDLTRFEFICAGRYIEHPAFHAALFGDLPALRFLLAPERAADRGLLFINVRHPTEGYTLLHQAVGGESVRLVVNTLKSPAATAKVVAFLLERGADPTIRDSEGETPADVARREGLEDVVRWLDEAAGKGDREEAARAAETELLGLLEQEEAVGQTKQGGGGGGGGSKKQKKKGKGKGKGGGQVAAAAAAAALAAVSLGDADDDKQPPQGDDKQGLSEEEAFILARARDEAPEFVCPLLGRIMRDAALASDGFSYERAAIEAHIERCQAAGGVPDSPKTAEPIDPMLLPNRSLRNLIEAFVEEQLRAFLAAQQQQQEQGGMG